MSITMQATKAAPGAQLAALSRILRDADARLRRAAPSTALGDERHAAVALFDATGALVAVSRPAWLASLAATVQGILATFGGTLPEGELALSNDPYAGGTHVNDLTLVRALSGGGGYLAARIHTLDVGGEQLGSVFPRAAEIWEEGVLVPALRLARGARADADVALMLGFNSRLPDVLRADLAAVVQTLEGLDAALAAAGLAGRDAHAAALDEARARLAGETSSLAEGSWQATGRIRHCCAGIDLPFTLRLTIGKGRIGFDFPEEPAGVPAFVNSPRGTTASALLAPLVAALPDAACNAALLDRVTVTTAAGSLFDARPPLPTGYAPYITAGELARAAQELFARAGLAAAPLGHWFALPARPFAMPGCADPACPFHQVGGDTHKTRYSPGARA
jgi:N-methylhydantoinase B/oxoprolinase/acetone carboxylase alpha subunit